jgi:anion-transporting  ArsA/GET3 family ATPase
VTGPALLEKRLHVVTGKGGVGKSTVAAALALLAAKRGGRILVCEVNAQERIAPLFGAPPSGATAREVAEGVWSVNVTPPEAMREYGLMVLRFRTIYDAVFENRVVRQFLRVIPSLAELVMLGKILHEVRVEEGGRPRWDAVIMDAPATGHAVQLLRVPSAMLDTVPPGPMKRDVEWMQALLLDERTTGVTIVTLPEEMPVNEAIELDAQLRGVLGLPRGALVVNAVPERRFDAAERALLPALAEADLPLGPAAQAARLQAIRAEQAARYVERARSALDLPSVVLPLVAADAWDRGAVETIAAALEPGLVAAGA